MHRIAFHMLTKLFSCTLSHTAPRPASLRRVAMANALIRLPAAAINFFLFISHLLFVRAQGTWLEARSAWHGAKLENLFSNYFLSPEALRRTMDTLASTAMENTARRLAAPEGPPKALMAKAVNASHILCLRGALFVRPASLLVRALFPGMQVFSLLFHSSSKK